MKKYLAGVTFTFLILIGVTGITDVFGQYMGNTLPPYTLEECIGCNIPQRIFTPPLKQVNLKITLPENILCNSDLELILKYNGSPACAKP